MRVGQAMRAVFACSWVAVGASASESIDEHELYPAVAEVSFDSNILGERRAFCLVTPPAVETQADDWPFLVLLHGRGRHHRSVVDVEALRQALLDVRFCTILPQGDDGWYIDSPVAPMQRYESYLEEVIGLAASIRPLSTNRQRRAIAGWSMGGYGAVRFGARHPAEFGAVASIIGLLDFPRPANLPKGRNYSVPVQIFGPDPADWPAFNPIDLAGNLQGTSVMLVTASDAFDRTMNENFHSRLNQLGIAHEYRVLPGAHKFDVVEAALPLVLNFVGRVFENPMKFEEQ